VPNCKSFLVTEAERKNIRRRAQFQQLGDASYHHVPPPLQGMAPKEIRAILTETLGEHVQSYATVKNWVAQFKRGDFSTYVAPRPGRPKTVTTPEIIDQVHELILKDSEDFDMRRLSKWVPKCLNADKKYQRCQSEQLLEFFRRDPSDFLSRLVTMDETWLYHYDPETKQQSMDWRHSGSPHPKKFQVKKSA